MSGSLIGCLASAYPSVPDELVVLLIDKERVVEWRLIEGADALSDGIYVWDGESLVEVFWTNRNNREPMAWYKIEHDNYGGDFYLINPQPKYYLHVTPPPEH